MSKHSQGNLSMFLFVRMRLAAARMVRANERANKARTKYQTLYVQRYGIPTIGQQLDNEGNLTNA